MRALTQEWIDKAEGHTRYAVEIRYPGELATREDARAAFQAMKVVRAFLHQRLGLLAVGC